MPDIGPTEIIIIAIVILVLFGATKMPTFARSIGRSMRIFKSEVKGMQDDDKDDKDDLKGLRKGDQVADRKTETAQLTEKPVATVGETVTDREEQRAGEQR